MLVIILALYNAGFRFEFFYTLTEPQTLRSIGFSEYKYSGMKTLKRGDILWCRNSKSQHTAIYLGNGKLIDASSNYDKKQGDSTGDEVAERNFNNDSNWEMYYRLNI